MFVVIAWECGVVCTWHGSVREYIHGMGVWESTYMAWECEGVHTWHGSVRKYVHGMGV